MITAILESASTAQLNAAVAWTSVRLHVSEGAVTDTVAVAYVIRHFRAGQFEGWEGFVDETRTS